ncbi:MAG: type VI secretion system protein TssA [Burkholderiales bacterium]|nr:type VI secretion system protein TssA [Nitrosomonas sp.]MCP5273347.1 type VI secretion system protein TssA [Burkholderiales bacterium]
MKLDELLKPISDEERCGSNLEDDPEFLSLENDIQGEPERYIGGIPAKEPKWNEIKSRAEILLLRTKDLNVAIWFARASTHCDGIGGLLTGLSVIQDYLTQYWDCVHPCLDPEDNNDPVQRVNILSQIGSYEIFVRDVHSVKLTFKNIQLTIRDILVTEGKINVLKEQSEYTKSQVEGIFHDPDNASIIQDLHQQLIDILALLKDLRKTLSQRLDDVSLLPSFDQLEAVLISVQRLCTVSISSDDEESAASTNTDTNTTMSSSISNTTAVGEIRSREDIVRVLEKVCRYIERTEPTNPAALIIRLAQTLMTKNFVEIMEMLPPEDLKIFKKILDSKAKK